MEILKLEYDATTCIIHASVPHMRTEGVTVPVRELRDEPEPSDAISLDELRAEDPDTAAAFVAVLAKLEPIIRRRHSASLGSPTDVAKLAALNAQTRRDLEAQKRAMVADREAHDKAIAEAKAMLEELKRAASALQPTPDKAA